MIGLVDGNNFYVSCECVFNRRLVGKPVAVLSNNDGCCVAMSPAFKALGIPRGTPYFQLKDREARPGSGEGLIFLSSNYELYGDMSRRIVEILRGESTDVEQYSIDEAFIHPPSLSGPDLFAYGVALRRKILRWVGIPCGVGFAPTRTLAKIANHIGKKRPEGVFLMPDDPSGILASLPVGEVWGVGRRLPAKLHAERIFTACELRDAKDDLIRSIGGVTLLRTAMELRGVAGVCERAYDADPDSVSCSRSFGAPVSTLAALSEAIAGFAAQAAVKLRRHRLLAAGCNVYAQVANPGAFETWSDTDGGFVGRTVVFPSPTDATNEILSAISRELPSLYVEGARYRKGGVVFFGLERAGAMRQLDLFAPVAASQASRLYETIDRLNLRFGRKSVASASEGLRLGSPTWQMKRDRLSKVSTTDWSRLPVAR